MKNTFYQQIVQALSLHQLDHNLFEHCVVNLLESDFPGISPIMGGSDSGMDGGVFDGAGAPYPLVTTVSDDCSVNLRRNLTEYTKKGGTRKKVVFATSRKLTPERRKKLREIAEELGFVLVQDCEQTKIADLLYRDPHWCKELLGLEGTPEALTTVPSGARRLLGERVIGRSLLIEAIETAGKDLVVVGPPGSGKTFGMYSIARKGLGLFVESTDLADIANGIRKYRPKLLFVDDAFQKRELVQALRRLKAELSADYKIVACGWTSHKDLLSNDLDVDSSAAFKVERLTRDEIVKVIHAVGVAGPNRLVDEIVNQADGLPGLATALCSAALSGNIEGIASADSLSKFLVNRLSEAVDHKAREVLAAIGLTGESGATLEQVAGALQLNPMETQKIAIGLAMGGVVHEQLNEKLVVRPVRLRGALIRDVFFAGAFSLNLDSVLPHLESPSVVNELIHAKLLGADVPDITIRKHLALYRRPVFTSHSHEDPWNLYAHLGSNESTVLLDQLGDDVGGYADVLLAYQPRETIRRMLNIAVGDERALHSHPEQPIRKLQDWIKAAKPNSNEAILRRKTLVHSAIDWHKNGGPQLEFLKGIEAAFCPACEWHENKPGSGFTINIFTSCLRKEQIKELFLEWDSVFQLLKHATTIEWKPILGLLHIWVYPGIINCKIEDAIYDQIHECARMMIQNLAGLTEANPGVRQRLAQYAKALELDADFACDEDFETLFPDDDVLRTSEVRKDCFEAAQSLVNKYERESADYIAKKVAFWEAEAKKAEIRGDAFIFAFCERLALRIANPLEFARAMSNKSVSPNLLWPFAVHVLKKKTDDWLLFFKGLFNSEAYKIIATLIVLQDGKCQELMPLALEHAPEATKALEISVLRGQVDCPTLGKLLRHNDPLLAVEVAIGLWHCDPRGEVPLELEKEWESAIVGSFVCENDFGSLDQIFDAKPALAFEWISRFVGETDSRWHYRSIQRMGEFCSKLTKSQKVKLIGLLKDESRGSWIIDKIVGHDVHLFKQVLASDNLRNLRTRPLGNFNATTWPAMAIEALNSGVSIEDVARSAFGHGASWSGNQSDMHQRRIAELKLVDVGDNSDLGKVIETLITWEKSSRNESLKRERHEAIYGER